MDLTEVKVYEYVMQENAKTTNTLTEIKIDGKVLESFDPDTNEYSINLEKLPELVEATAIDNASVTILPIYNNKSTIVVRAEDGSKNAYTVNYVLPAPKEYTVTVNKTEGGAVAGAGKYVEGEEVTLIATANEGYNFIGWFEEEGKEVSKDATYRFIINSDVVLNAKFEKVPEVVDPSEPTDPEEPTNPENPSNPGEPTDPSDPIDQGKPVDPSNPGNQGGSNDSNNSTGDSDAKLPLTGSVVSSTQILVLALVLLGVGTITLRKRKYGMK